MLSVAAMATDDTTLPERIHRMPIHRHFRDGRLSVWEHEIRRLPEMRRAHPGLFHNPSPHAPIAPVRPWVQTLFDVIPLVWDDPALQALKKRWRRFGPRYAKADAVIAISKHAADEGCRMLGIDRRRTTVIHLGVGPEFRPGPAHQGGRPYVAIVSEFSRRKGFDTAIRVSDALCDSGYPHELAIAGRVRERQRPDFEQVMGTSRHPERIRILGFVDDLASLYRGAALYLMPSSYEGFGLTAIEAMACGTPVVAFSNSAIPEVVGDAAVLVPDGDVAAMIRAVKTILGSEDLREDLTGRGLERATHFRWEDTAAAHAHVYRE